MTAWSDLGGTLVSGAAAASWGSEETQVFAILEDGALWNRYWDGASWHDWESLGGSFRGQPAAAARAADRIDVFAIGTDGSLQHRWWDGREWVPWERVPDAPSDPRAVACTWIGPRLDVFVQAASGGLHHADLA